MIQTVSDGRLVGYARVSTDDQNLTLQIDSLISCGVTKELLFTDKISGAKSDRPGLDKCLSILKHGDTLLVWRLDRLGRSMAHLVKLIEELRERSIGFRSVSDGVIDSTSASGELIFHIFSALAQFERRLIQERTRAGLEAARARGRTRLRITNDTLSFLFPYCFPNRLDESTWLAILCHWINHEWTTRPPFRLPDWHYIDG